MPDAVVLPVRAASVRVVPRTVYPYSIIRGGAWSRTELVNALDRDPVAAEHYRGFRAESAHVEQMPAARAAYVSFRKNDKVYWTRHTVTLAAGEAVLSDGENLARARCGNRISFTPRTPTGPDVDLETPEPAPTVLGGGDTPDAFHLPLLVHELFPPASLVLSAADAPGGGPASAQANGYPAWFGGGGGVTPVPERPAAAPAPQSSPLPAPEGPALPGSFSSGDLAVVAPPAPLPFAGATIGPSHPGPGATGASGGVYLVVGTSGNPTPRGASLTPGGGTSPGGSGGRSSGGGGGTPPPAGGTTPGGDTPGGPGGPGDTPPLPGGLVPNPPPPPDAPPSETPEPAAIWLVGVGAGILAIRRAMR
jgi:hypothetical protein